jgi:ankyrin repeat protein
MSDSSASPSNVNLEYFRKQAKKLLRDCREGNPAAIARMQSQLPRIQDLTSEEIRARLKLADVQHAIAREQGFANWAELKLSDYSPTDQFLAAVRNGALARTKQHVDELSKLAYESIHAACAIGDIDALRQHLERDSSLLTAERGGWPPLIYACASPLCRLNSRYAAGILQCVMLLLERGVDPNSSTTAETGEAVEAGTLVSAVTRAGLSSNTAVYWLLLQRGGAARAAENITKNVMQRIPEGESMIQAFSRTFNSTEARDLFAQMRENLRLNPPPPNHLSFADYYDRGAALAKMGPMGQDLAGRGFSLFMKHGLKLTNRPSGPDLETPLHRIAISGGSIEMAKTLLGEGADPNVRRPDGRTPYELAVRHGNDHVAELLLSHGASTAGVRPIDQLLGACIRNDEEGAKAILLKHPDLTTNLDLVDSEAIVRLAGRNKLDTMRMMAGLGFHLTARGESGSTPLHVAAWHGHVDMVRLLLDNGAPVNARDATYNTSALAWAADGSKNCRLADDDYCIVITALIDAGAEYASAVNHWGVGPERVCSPAVEKVISRLL